MENGDYEGAVAEFDSLIDQTKHVSSFEIDVLKYRGEAEFMLGDYGAAAYTYDTLVKVDKPRAALTVPESFVSFQLVRCIGDWFSRS